MPAFALSEPREEWLDGEAGRVFTRHWRPDGPPRAAITICHGVNSHGGQYYGAAQEFVSRGYAVTALDLRGRGKSDGERYYVERVEDYVADLSLAVELARSHDPRVPLFLLGHSAGGVTAVAYTLDHQDRIDGLICESFAFRVYAPDFALKLLEGASHLAPHVHVLKLKMEDFSRDPAWVKHLLADPYTEGEVQPVQTVAALARAGERFEREFGRITLPVLIMHGTADKATRPDGSEEFFAKAGSADKQLVLYDDYYHDLLNDLGKERVFADIAAWIDARLPGEEQVEAAMPPITG